MFFLFGFLTLVALAYFWRKVPETKGRSLHEIEHQLASPDPRAAREGRQALEHRAPATGTDGTVESGGDPRWEDDAKKP